MHVEKNVGKYKRNNLNDYIFAFRRDARASAWPLLRASSSPGSSGRTLPRSAGAALPLLRGAEVANDAALPRAGVESQPDRRPEDLTAELARKRKIRELNRIVVLL